MTRDLPPPLDPKFEIPVPSAKDFFGPGAGEEDAELLATGAWGSDEPKKRTRTVTVIVHRK